MSNPVEEIKTELADFLNDAAGAHAIARRGIQLAGEQALVYVDEAIDPERHVDSARPQVLARRDRDRWPGGRGHSSKYAT